MHRKSELPCDRIEAWSLTAHDLALAQRRLNGRGRRGNLERDTAQTLRSLVDLTSRDPFPPLMQSHPPSESGMLFGGGRPVVVSCPQVLIRSSSTLTCLRQQTYLSVLFSWLIRSIDLDEVLASS